VGWAGRVLGEWSEDLRALSRDMGGRFVILTCELSVEGPGRDGIEEFRGRFTTYGGGET